MKSVVAMLCGVFAVAGLGATVLGQDHGQAPPATPSTPSATPTPSAPSRGSAAADARIGDPYPFDTCPMTGQKFAATGALITKVYDGQEVRFCCAQCPAKFLAYKARNIATLDEKIIKDQGPLYPLTTSLVTGQDLSAKPYEFVYGNRLIRLGADTEKVEFMKDPGKYFDALNKAVISQQSKNYPLGTCVVSGEKFGGAMGEAVNVVIAGRLVKLCCAACKQDLEQNPAKFLGMVNAARQSASK